jgi:hypothetical protein
MSDWRKHGFIGLLPTGIVCRLLDYGHRNDGSDRSWALLIDRRQRGKLSDSSQSQILTQILKDSCWQDFIAIERDDVAGNVTLAPSMPGHAVSYLVGGAAVCIDSETGDSLCAAYYSGAGNPNWYIPNTHLLYSVPIKPLAVIVRVFSVSSEDRRKWILCKQYFVCVE